MPQALPPSLAALLAREDFADEVFESGRCAHSVGEAKPIFELALDRLLAALDGESTVSPSGGYGSGARGELPGARLPAGTRQRKRRVGPVRPCAEIKFHGALTSMACTRRTG